MSDDARRNMISEFQYDVFLSHSAKDKAVVRPLAERLRADGLKVWFDEWVLKPGDSIPAKIEEGLERSRVLVLCMSAHAFGSDWAQLARPAVASLRRRKSGTCGRGNLPFREPVNKERRFIPLRPDDACPNGASASSPRLAPRAYLGFTTPIRDNPNGVASPAGSDTRLQPRWGCGFSRRFPRVARASQPWALRRSPVGAECPTMPDET